MSIVDIVLVTVVGGAMLVALLIVATSAVLQIKRGVRDKIRKG